MKLIKFGSRQAFYEWFWRGKRSDNYPLIEFNYSYCREEDTCIYRAIENGKDVGIIFISDLFPGEMWIDLFEINSKFHRKGLGTEMFKLLMEKYKPNFLQLECAEDNNKEALTFWKKMGFRKKQYDSYYEHLMYKNFTKKYWKNYDARR